jgi:hypothetical protein
MLRDSGKGMCISFTIHKNDAHYCQEILSQMILSYGRLPERYDGGILPSHDLYDVALKLFFKGGDSRWRLLLSEMVLDSKTYS